MQAILAMNMNMNKIEKKMYQTIRFESVMEK